MMNRAVAWLAGMIAAFALLTCVAAANPPGHPVRIGVLGVEAPSFDPAENAFARELVEGLRQLGYTKGRDCVFEYRSALGQPEAWPAIIREVLATKVDMVVAPLTQPALEAANATSTVPIVMVGTADPVETGIVESLAKPGRNVTGLAINAAEIAAKRVQLLQEAVPGLSKVAVLWNGNIKSMTLAFQNIEQASPRLGVTIQSVRVASSDDFEKAFTAIQTGHPGGLVVLYGPFRGNDLPRVVEFVALHKIPTVFELGRGIGGGGLMEFGPDYLPMVRRAAIYIDKIANGANPATLPIEEPTGFQLIINLKAAKSMGIDIPQPLLLRADKIVE